MIRGQPPNLGGSDGRIASEPEVSPQFLPDILPRPAESPLAVDNAFLLSRKPLRHLRMW